MEKSLVSCGNSTQLIPWFSRQIGQLDASRRLDFPSVSCHSFDVLTLGDQIRAARGRARMTQRELADRVGVSTKTVDNWENGRSVPRNRLAALEEVLGTHLNVDGVDELGPAKGSDPRDEVAERVIESFGLSKQGTEEMKRMYRYQRWIEDQRDLDR